MARRRYSHQREILLEALRNTASHPSAERLYEELKLKHPKLSLGTVYRNLKLLSQEGQIQRIGHHVDHYDAELREHVHFLCRKCGEVYDLDCPPPDSEFPTSEHKLEHRSVCFRGICRKCSLENQ